MQDIKTGPSVKELYLLLLWNKLPFSKALIRRIET